MAQVILLLHNGERALDVRASLVERAGGERLPAGSEQCLCRPVDLDGSPSLEQVVREIRDLLANATAIHLLERLGSALVTPLPPGQRERADEGLSNQLVCKGVARVPADRLREDEPRRFRGLERIENGISAQLPEGGEDLEVEPRTDHRGRGEQGTAVRTHALEAAPDHELHALGDLEGLEVKLG